MYNPLEIIFRFPRLYMKLHLFGSRSIYCDLGWFRDDHEDDWKVALEITPLAILGGKDWKIFYGEVALVIGRHHLAITVGKIHGDV